MSVAVCMDLLILFIVVLLFFFSWWLSSSQCPSAISERALVRQVCLRWRVMSWSPVMAFSARSGVLLLAPVIALAYCA